MKNTLLIKEYQYITCNEDYKESLEYAFLRPDLFQELENFILQSEQEVDQSVAADFFNITVKRGIGKVIGARNYVGLIQMKQGTQIEILPKIYFPVAEIENDRARSEIETKKIFIKMLRSLKDFPNKVYSDANLAVANMNLYEIFISMYIQEVRWLVKKGLKLNYTPVEENQTFFKGKLLVNQHIRFNLTHGERFYISHDEFNANRPENKLIKSTLIKLTNLSNSSENTREIRQLLAHFENIDPSYNYENDFSRITLDRNTQMYERIMQWSRVFLLNKSFTSFSGTTNARALLFPMEKLFESYVAQQLRLTLGGSDCEVIVQDKGYYLFDAPTKQFALRPDIVINFNGRTIILDTKWKLLDQSSKNNYGISQSDMYQMYAYAKKYDTDEVLLLYPKSQLVDELNIKIEYQSNDRVNVKVFFVDLINIEDSMAELREQLMV